MKSMRALGAMVAVAFTLLLVTSAEAQLPKRGTYTSTFGWNSSGKIFEIEKDHQFFVGEFSGTNFNDAGRGFLHLTSWVCPGVNDIVKGVFNAHGYCTVTDGDGDKVFTVWKCSGPVPRCTGDDKLTGGTGKYAGITGSNTFYGEFTGTTFQQGYSVLRGDWQLP